nr:MAG TPA: hypothetical protein [Caudoviricetes sp.]
MVLLTYGIHITSLIYISVGKLILLSSVYKALRLLFILIFCHKCCTMIVDLKQFIA